MDWEELLKMDVAGWDVEAHEGAGGIFRGPLESIRQEGKLVYFNAKWMAAWQDGDTWINWNNTQCFVNVEFSSLTKDANGRIRLPIPYVGFLILFPPSENNLSASKVQGLVQ